MGRHRLLATGTTDLGSIMLTFMVRVVICHWRVRQILLQAYNDDPNTDFPYDGGGDG